MGNLVYLKGFQGSHVLGITQAHKYAIPGLWNLPGAHWKWEFALMGHLLLLSSAFKMPRNFLRPHAYC
jgi:hypothetical protein